MNLMKRVLAIRLRRSTATKELLFSTTGGSHIGSVEEIEYFGRKKQTDVSLKALMETGKGMKLNAEKSGGDSVPIQVACFLHRELPVRLAHRVVELEKSELFMKSAHIRNVCSWYKTSFAQLRLCPAPTNKEKEQEFAKVIESVYERHAATLVTMAKGAHQIRQFMGQDMNSFAEYTDIQRRLDEFYLSRIAIRTVRTDKLQLYHY